MTVRYGWGRPHPRPPMPTVRVFLRCATPTNRTGGLYDTFVNVTPTSFARGAHVAIAEERARLLGYAGPYRATEVRVLSVEPMQTGPAARAAMVEARRVHMRDRLNALLESADSASAASSERGLVQPEASQCVRTRRAVGRG